MNHEQYIGAGEGYPGGDGRGGGCAGRWKGSGMHGAVQALASEAYEVGEMRRYGGLLYRCLTAHQGQDSWTPDAAPSLWVRVDNPAVEWPEWVQPTGATDAYSSGAKVSHGGKHWVSLVDANVWEPGVYGWEEVV